MSAANYNNVCFFYLKGFCAFGSRCHKLHVEPVQDSANKSNGNSPPNLCYKQDPPEAAAKKEPITSDRILELKRGIDNSLFGRNDPDDTNLDGEFSLSLKDLAIKPLDEQKSQNCNPPGSSTSNLFIEEEKIACDNSKKLSFQETQIMKEAALEIQNVESPSFSYSSVSALGSTLKGISTKEYVTQHNASIKGTIQHAPFRNDEEFSNLNGTNEDRRRFLQDDFLNSENLHTSITAPLVNQNSTLSLHGENTESEHFLHEERTLSKKERKNLERLRKVSSESSENKDPHAKKYRDKMCHAFSHLHDKKSDESIKAFTEIIKDKSVKFSKQEALFGRCKSQILKRNLTLALIDISKAINEPFDTHIYVEIKHKDELFIEMASLQLKFGLVEQARKSLSRLSKPGKEVKEQIDTFEDNYNDIDELLRQFMPQELVKEGKRQEFKEFANRIIDFNKDIGFQAYEKVKLCSSMAPEFRSLKLLELECLIRQTDKIRAEMALKKLKSMKLTLEEKQNLKVLHLIFKYTFTFNWSYFPVPFSTSPTPVQKLVTDINKAANAMTGPKPKRWELFTFGSIPSLFLLETEAMLLSVEFSIEKHSYQVLMSGPTNSNVIQRLLALAEASKKSSSTTTLAERKRACAFKKRTRRLTI